MCLLSLCGCILESGSKSRQLCGERAAKGKQSKQSKAGPSSKELYEVFSVGSSGEGVCE